MRFTRVKRTCKFHWRVGTDSQCTTWFAVVTCSYVTWHHYQRPDSGEGPSLWRNCILCFIHKEEAVHAFSLPLFPYFFKPYPFFFSFISLSLFPFYLRVCSYNPLLMEYFNFWRYYLYFNYYSVSDLWFSYI